MIASLKNSPGPLTDGTESVVNLLPLLIFLRTLIAGTNPLFNLTGRQILITSAALTVLTVPASHAIDFGNYAGVEQRIDIPSLRLLETLLISVTLVWVWACAASGRDFPDRAFNNKRSAYTIVHGSFRTIGQLSDQLFQKMKFDDSDPHLHQPGTERPKLNNTMMTYTSAINATVRNLRENNQH